MHIQQRVCVSLKTKVFVRMLERIQQPDWFPWNSAPAGFTVKPMQLKFASGFECFNFTGIISSFRCWCCCSLYFIIQNIIYGKHCPVAGFYKEAFICKRAHWKPCDQMLCANVLLMHNKKYSTIHAIYSGLLADGGQIMQHLHIYFMTVLYARYCDEWINTKHSVYRMPCTTHRPIGHVCLCESEIRSYKGITRNIHYDVCLWFSNNIFSTMCIIIIV